MSQIVAVARFKVRDGAQAEAEAVFERLVSASHDDQGCVTYAMHRVKDDPTGYVLIERWESQADVDAHLGQPHMAEIGGELGGVLAGPVDLVFLEPLPFGDPAKGVLGR
jgi:quinol monooxygenase YgiN